jgi:hypothetical protein
MPILSEKQIKALVTASREQARALHDRSNAARTGSLLPAPSRPMSAAAASFLDSAGVDRNRLERDLAGVRKENSHLLAEAKVEAEDHSAAHAKRLNAVVQERRAALEALVAAGPPSGIQYEALDRPVEIWTTDYLELASSSIQPWNSWAKVDYKGQLYGGFPSALLEAHGTETLHFYFLWQNTRTGYAIVTVDAFLVLNGYCSVHSRGGVIDGGEALLSLDAHADLLQTWTTPISSPVAQGGQTQRALDLDADSTGWFTDDQTKTAIVYRGYDLRYEQAIVPPGQYLIIDASVAFSYGYLNGEVDADFASAAFQISCPFVQVAVLP